MINLVEPEKKPLNRFWGRDYPAGRSPLGIETCVTVVKVDLDIEGVADNKEESEGKTFVVNWDDDDNDSTADKDDDKVLGGDNDLQKIILQKVEPTTLTTGKVALTWSSNKIKVYESNDKTNPITSGKEYELTDLPKSLYVEGQAGSDSMRDVEVVLGYSEVTCVDRVRFTAVEVVITLRNSDSLSPKAEYYKRDTVVTIVGTDKLGDLTPAEANNWATGLIEVVGAVKPAGFTGTFGMGRTLVKKRVYSNGTLDTSFSKDNVNDPSGVLDGTPSATSKIYDADAPGEFLGAALFTGKPVGTIFASRRNFEQWFTFGSAACSGKKKWHMRKTMKKTAATWVKDGVKNDIGGGWEPIAY